MAGGAGLAPPCVTSEPGPGAGLPSAQVRVSRPLREWPGPRAGPERGGGWNPELPWGREAGVAFGGEPGRCSRVLGSRAPCRAGGWRARVCACVHDACAPCTAASTPPASSAQAPRRETFLS